MAFFRLKEEHLTLLRRMYVYWEDCEYGAPAVDCKRPYGNSGVESDIAEILGWDLERCPHCKEPLANTSERAAEIHMETLGAVMLILKRAGLATPPGDYEL